ncbi:TonB-dependent receptor [Novosphingobium sp. PC22D]|uniref:TonB-dependent receptor n=1 Tax=Novosphingobium sp. PC22D TaxID=1962403 RepID=UPI000BEF562B|nr:TonB-dependent receptor [Novosphingobium sp. PC22D]
MKALGHLLVLGAGTVAMAWSASAAAQVAEANDAGEAERGGQAYEEILVTARKRTESIMDVPVVKTTIDQSVLENFQTQDLKSLSTLVPGLTLGTSILSVGLQASIRGVGTSALDPGVDSSVALNIDGMAFAQGLVFASGMFDVGQVEVLKGPQSLFYGKSSPAGVISIRTADPTDEFELIARAGYEFEADEQRYEAIVSGPVADTLRLRLAGTYGKQKGFFTDRAQAIPALGSKDPGGRITPAKDYKVRFTALWEPTDTFSTRLKVNHVYDDTDYPGSAQIVLCPDGQGPYNGFQFIDPNDCKLDRNIPLVDLDPAAFPGIENNGTPFNKTRQTYGTLEVNGTISPGLTLTTLTGLYFARSRSMVNATMSSAGAGLISASNRFKRDQITHEMRLTSDFTTPLNFTLGGFLERGKFEDNVRIGGNTVFGVPATLQQGIKSVDIETNSVFGQVLYKVVPKVEIALGARYTDERRDQKGFNTISGSRVPVALAVPEIRAKNLAPELSVTFQPNDDLTIFGSLKRGYKSGSFNVSTPPFAGENNAFGDEKVEGGELGIKSRLADRPILFNVAGYYYKYSGLQVGANVQAESGITVTRTVNAGRARVYGLEADVTYRPWSLDGLAIRAGVNWNDSKYTSLVNVPCYGGQLVSEGCNLLFSPAANGGTGGFTAQDRSGIPLLRAPKWSGVLGINYDLEVGGDMTLVLASNTQFSSKQLLNLGYLYYQDAYLKTDLSATLKAENWELALIGKNLNNELTSGNCANSNRAAGALGGLITGSTVRGPAGIDEVGCYMDRGRELWIRATFKY